MPARGQPPGMRLCSRCRTLGRDPHWHPLRDFYRATARPDGYMPWCKACCKETQRNLAHRRRTGAAPYFRILLPPPVVPTHTVPLEGTVLVKPSRLAETRRRYAFLRKLIKQQQGRCAVCGQAEGVRNEWGLLQRLSLYGNPGMSPMLAALCTCCVNAASLMRHSARFTQRLADFLRQAVPRSGPKEHQELVASHDDPLLPEPPPED